MLRSQCRHCHRSSIRTASRALLLPRSAHPRLQAHIYHSASSLRSKDQQARRPRIDIHALLSQPTWSVKSLVAEPPPSSNTSHAPGGDDASPSISSKQLHHLLRLSALPAPASAAEEEKMLATLATQLRFVRDVQSVDTAGVEPLQAIRDETAAGIQERTIGLDSLKDALAEEVVVGRNRRPRRPRSGVTTSTVRQEGGDKKHPNSVEDWDVLSMAEGKVGRYFVVNSSKE